MAICGTFSVAVLSEADADIAVAGYKHNKPPPKKVTKVQNADQSWTVTADFGACAENVSHSTTGS